MFGHAPSGSTQGARLLVTPVGLFLSNTDEGTELWLSADGKSWQHANILNGVSALGLTQIVWAHGLLVAIFSNKYTGSGMTAYGGSDTVWTSANGTHWRQGRGNGIASFTFLAPTVSGSWP